MQNPARTLRIAGPLAVIVVAILYTLTNIAYFVGASKEEIMGSGRLVVSLLMNNIWGEKIERWVDFGVALSALGNVLAVVSRLSFKRRDEPFAHVTRPSLRVGSTRRPARKVPYPLALSWHQIARTRRHWSD